MTEPAEAAQPSPIPEPSQVREPSPIPEPSQVRPEDRGGQRSGLRNPDAAIRGLGAGTLAMEAIVLLLAIQPIRVLGGRLGGWGVGVVVALAVVALLLCGMMRRPWAWHAGTAVQVVLLLAGFLHWSLGVLGLIFAVVWAYATHVRRTILG